MKRTPILTDDPSAEQPKSKTIPLSVSIIAHKGDTHWMDKMFKSLPDGCEVVVLWNEQGATDTGATHRKTENVGNRVVSFYDMTYTDEYKSFSELRNECLRYCTREWIMQIDCDEQVSNTDATFWERLTDTYPAGIGGLICGVYGIQPPFMPSERALRFMEPQIRIFRRGFQFYGHCHEQVLYAIEDAGFSLFDCSVLFHHSGYRVDADSYVNKMHRNTKLLSRQFAEEQDPKKLKFFLGLLLRDGNNLQELLKDK